MHCLKWVMRLYTSKLTPDSVVTYLFIDCECSLWLFCLAWHVCVCVMIKAQYTSTDRPPVLRVCAMFDGLTEFWFEFRFSFRASLLDFTSRIERLHVCYYCADVLNVLAYFCSEYSRASPSTGRSCQVIDSVCMPRFSWRAWPISCSRSTVAVAARDTDLDLFTRCAPVRNSLQTSCLQGIMARYHNDVISRHSAGDRSTKVGHEIN